jgi:hypothetical protein
MVIILQPGSTTHEARCPILGLHAKAHIIYQISAMISISKTLKPEARQRNDLFCSINFDWRSADTKNARNASSEMFFETTRGFPEKIPEVEVI